MGLEGKCVAFSGQGAIFHQVSMRGGEAGEKSQKGPLQETNGSTNFTFWEDFIRIYAKSMYYSSVSGFKANLSTDGPHV